jgi:transcriptional regulator with XRE-family HTH domain
MIKQKVYLAINVKHLRTRKGWHQDELAAKLGITRSKVALIELGKTVNPPLEDVVNFAEIFSVSTDSLLRKDLTNLSEPQLMELEAGNDPFATGTTVRFLATTVDSDNNFSVDLVPEKARAGYRTGYSDPEWIAELPRYAIPGLSKHRKHRIFPIAGDSMLPYPDGCYIVGEYLEDWTTLKNDTLCVLILKSGGADFVFKQIENRVKKNRVLLAKSLNSNYPPFEVPVSEVLEVWKYKLHIASTISCPSVEVSTDQLMRMMQEVKMEVGKLSAQLNN